MVWRVQDQPHRRCFLGHHPAIIVMLEWFLQANGSPATLAAGTPTCCVWDQRFAFTLGPGLNSFRTLKNKY